MRSTTPISIAQSFPSGLKRRLALPRVGSWLLDTWRKGIAFATSVKASIIDSCEDCFERFGYHVFDHPWHYIIWPILICFLCGVGHLYRRVELDMEVLYALRESPTQTARTELHHAFPVERVTYIFAESKKPGELLTKESLTQLDRFWGKVNTLGVPASLAEAALAPGSGSLVAEWLKDNTPWLLTYGDESPVEANATDQDAPSKLSRNTTNGIADENAALLRASETSITTSEATTQPSEPQSADIITLETVCLRNGAKGCRTVTPLDLYGTPSLWGAPLRTTQYPYFVNFHTGNAFRLDAILGGVDMKKSPTGTVSVRAAKAGVFRLDLDGDPITKTLSNSLTVEHPLMGLTPAAASALWEQALLCLIDAIRLPSINLYVKAARSVNDELALSSQLLGRDILTLAAATVFVTLFTVGASFSRNTMRTKWHVALVGVVSTGLAYLGGVGLCYLFGLTHVPPSESTPFIVLGIGVDDVFVIINAFSMAYLHTDDARTRVATSLRDSGVSITITTVTNILAFIIGATSVYHAIHVFCIVTAAGLTAGYFLCLTLVVAALSLDARREQRLAEEESRKAKAATLGTLPGANEQTDPACAPTVEATTHAEVAEQRICGGEELTTTASLETEEDTVGSTEADSPSPPSASEKLTQTITCDLFAASIRESPDPESAAKANTEPLTQTEKDLIIRPTEAPELIFDDAGRLVHGIFAVEELTNQLVIAERIAATLPQTPRKSTCNCIRGVRRRRRVKSGSTSDSQACSSQSDQDDEGGDRLFSEPPQGRKRRKAQLPLLFRVLLFPAQVVTRVFRWCRKDDRPPRSGSLELRWLEDTEPESVASTLGSEALPSSVVERMGGGVTGAAAALDPDYDNDDDDCCGRPRACRRNCMTPCLDVCGSQHSCALCESVRNPRCTCPVCVRKRRPKTAEQQEDAVTDEIERFDLQRLPRMLFRGNEDYFIALDSTNLEEPDGIVGHIARSFFINIYGPLLMRPTTKVLTLIFFLVLLVFSAFNCSQVTSGLTVRELTPIRSYLRSFYDVREEYFSAFGDECVVFFPHGGRWWDPRIQEALLTLTEDLRRSPHIVFVLSGMEEFLLNYWRPYIQGVGERKEKLSAQQLNQEFIETLEKWLQTPRGRLHSLEFVIQKSEDGTKSVLTTWKFLYWMKFLDNTRIAITWLQETQKLLGEAEAAGLFRGHVFTPLAVVWESDPTIFPATMSNCLVALISMGVVASVLIPDLKSGIMVLIVICMIDIDVYGFMSIWGLSLNMMTMVNLVLSIGFAVDYTAHITHCFNHCKGRTRNHRMIETLVLMGLPVTNGMTSTYAAVAALSLSDKYVLRVIFKMTTSVLVFAFIHGIVLMPIVLSLIGPLPPREVEVLKVCDGVQKQVWTVDAYTGKVLPQDSSLSWHQGKRRQALARILRNQRQSLFACSLQTRLNRG